MNCQVPYNSGTFLVAEEILELSRIQNHSCTFCGFLRWLMEEMSCRLGRLTRNELDS
jgi:hypothetical protein